MPFIHNNYYLHVEIAKLFNPGEVLGLIFAEYVPLASQSPYPIIVYSVANIIVGFHMKSLKFKLRKTIDPNEILLSRCIRAAEN